jgi:hypothetical protein
MGGQVSPLTLNTWLRGPQQVGPTTKTVGFTLPLARSTATRSRSARLAIRMTRPLPPTKSANRTTRPPPPTSGWFARLGLCPDLALALWLSKRAVDPTPDQGRRELGKTTTHIVSYPHNVLVVRPDGGPSGATEDIVENVPSNRSSTAPRSDSNLPLSHHPPAKTAHYWSAPAQSNSEACTRGPRRLDIWKLLLGTKHSSQSRSPTPSKADADHIYGLLIAHGCDQRRT